MSSSPRCELIPNKPGNSSLTVDIFKKPEGLPSKKRRKKILDEDLYLEGISKIIERDFFPHLEKLKAQNEYLDAVSENDISKLRDLYAKYSAGKRPPTDRLDSPATFETPSVLRTDEEFSNFTKKHEKRKDNEDEQEDKTNIKPNQNLDQYLAVHTSEDNESYREVQEESIKKHMMKHGWLYKNEAEYDIQQRLALPSIEQQAAGEERSLMVDTWSYKNQNSVMYVPEGAELSLEERIDMALKRREIVYSNTRLAVNPFDEDRNKETIQGLAMSQAKTMEGRIGVDGKVMTTDSTPLVNGWSFVKTPSPMPGVSETPLMTWGEIEGTPFRLDGSDTPRPTNGPSFRIAEIPRRERLAHELADKVSEQNRDKKKKAIETAKFNLTAQSPRRQMSSLERLHEMSPAAQRLASVSLKRRLGTDTALRHSYSPSPRRTSILTPSRTPTHLTPSHSNKLARRATPISITDDLLKIPTARPKASDFF